MSARNEFEVDPEELRVAARGLEQCAARLTELHRGLESTHLTLEDWGPAWLSGSVNEAYLRARHEQMAEASHAAGELTDTVTRLLASAREYRAAEETTAEAADAAGADGDGTSSRT